jgi:hypothetical protein
MNCFDATFELSLVGSASWPTAVPFGVLESSGHHTRCNLEMQAFYQEFQHINQKNPAHRPLHRVFRENITVMVALKRRFYPIWDS